MDFLDEAAKLSNAFAPEHLSIHHELIPKIRHAGSIFVGPAAVEAAGDYFCRTQLRAPHQRRGPRVSEQESYAANCVRVNERVLVAAGYPLLTAELKARGFQPLELDMSEFQKMDGGLSCLSLRF